MFPLPPPPPPLCALGLDGLEEQQQEEEEEEEEEEERLAMTRGGRGGPVADDGGGGGGGGVGWGGVRKARPVVGVVGGAVVMAMMLSWGRLLLWGRGREGESLSISDVNVNWCRLTSRI